MLDCHNFGISGVDWRSFWCSCDDSSHSQALMYLDNYRLPYIGVTSSVLSRSEVIAIFLLDFRDICQRGVLMPCLWVALISITLWSCMILSILSSNCSWRIDYSVSWSTYKHYSISWFKDKRFKNVNEYTDKMCEQK